MKKNSGQKSRATVPLRGNCQDQNVERGDNARAMGESKVVVCSVTEKSNDYFAVHSWERLFR
jgi:hypothetical protein